MALLSIVSGIILYYAWPNNGVFPLLFVGFVPLLFALEILSKKQKRFSSPKAFLLIFTTYFIWTSLSLTWLYKTAADSHFITVLLTAFNYSLFLAFFPYIYKKLGKNYALVYFASALLLADWVSQVYLLSTPYFNLGLGLGKAPWLIQHYQWIGIEGGGLWIILTNIFIFKLISEKTYSFKKLIPLSSLVILFPVLSVVIYSLPEETNGKSATVTLHHSSIDPNTQEAFSNPVMVIDSLFNSTFNHLSEIPDVVVWPETVIIRLGWLHKLDAEPTILYLKNRLKKYPNTTLVFGAIGFSHAKNETSKSKYTTYVPEGNYYYNTHNVAVTVASNKTTLIKSKEKFIPFHERIPYINTLPFLTNLIDAVGTRAMFTPFKGGNPLTMDLNGNHFESVLCYESLFSLFMAKKSTRKIGAILVHANEHWLKDIAGSKQYLYENVAIAIQGGKPLLRSSNGGVTTIVNRKGDIISPIVGQKTENLTAKINLNYSTTIYSKIAGVFYAGGGISSFLIFFLSLFKKSSNII